MAPASSLSTPAPPDLPTPIFVPHKSDIFTVTSILGAITARQEQIAWWLQAIAAAVAIVAGVIAIYQKLRRPRRD